MPADDSRATTPKHRSITQELQRLLDLYHRKHPSSFIVCHPHLHRQQHSYKDDSSLCVDTPVGNIPCVVELFKAVNARIEEIGVERSLGFADIKRIERLILEKEGQ
jgi:hypothetical protein